MFNTLPLDLQSNILKYNPYARSLNKTYTNMNQQLFYEQQCDLPISKHEFVSYINQYSPKKFAIFVDEGLKFNIYMFNCYYLNYHNIKEYIVDIYSFTWDNGIIFYYNCKSGSVNQLLNTLSYSSSFIDLILSKNILEQRPCQSYNPNYIQNYLTKHFNKIINEPDDLWELFKNKLYLMYNIDINNNTYELVDFVDDADTLYNFDLNNQEFVDLIVDHYDTQYDLVYNKYVNL
jgi:hypothetical protein